VSRDEDEDARKDADDEEAAERDASTKGVAEALGVDAAEGAEGESESAEAAAPNRSKRRREQALERRKKRAPKAAPAKAAAAEDDDIPIRELDPTLPKDKNARAKELLKRRHEAVSKKVSGAAIGLDTGEMVQDALARGTSAATSWIRKNGRLVVAGGLVALLGVGGYLFFVGREQAKAGDATGALADALAADRGRILKEDKRTDEEKELDPTRVYSSSDQRASAAIEGYQKALASTTEAGPTTLARLGLAGAQLEKGEAKAALESYASVLASPLANADADVKARAVEGSGLAKEAVDDVDGALKSFEELAKIPGKGFEELGLYHQARLWDRKGDKAKAKELLKTAREKLSAPSEAGQAFPFLEAVVDGHLRSLDPTAAPARVQLGGAKGNAMSPEELDRIQEQLRKALEKKSKEHGEEHEGEGEGMPGMPHEEPH
jgi:predicted negative regulator of RcsB-dependent stress response